MSHDSDPRRRRVLLLVENMSVPTDRRVWSEARSLARDGYAVTVICPTGRGRDLEAHVTVEGISIHRYPSHEARSNTPSYLSEYARALWHMRRQVRRLAAVAPFEIVHLANPPDVLFLATAALRRQGARIVFDQHDLVPELFEARFGSGRGLVYRAAVVAERRAFRAAGVVISPNESYRRIAIERGGKAPEDTFVVRIAPDLEVFSPGPPDPSLKRGKQFLLVYAGTMGHQDGVDHALRALKLLSRRRQDWHALLAGAGDAANDMRRLTAELGLSDLVEFTGHLDDAPLLRTLRSADVCLSPEPSNPLNDASTMIKVVEYMALACPIVAFDLAETRVSAGGAALYASSNDAAAFATCIERLLDDEPLRRELGQRGRARVETELSWARSEEQLLAAYERVLSARSR